jgi:pimeloyl-ACP methyl ester carboxylesterase
VTPEPATIELGGGAQLRGSQWPVSDRWTLLVHDLGDGHDIDELTPLAGAVVRSGSSAVAFDLPGHGFSDGTWDPGSDPTAALGTMLGWVECQEPAKTGIVAIGAACYPALQIAQKRRVDVLVLVSPPPDPDLDAFPTRFRGAGAAKLLIYGGADSDYRATATELRKRSIGWAVSLSVGSTDQRAALLAGPLSARVQEEIELFMREQWKLGRRRDAPTRHTVKESAR